MAKQRRCTSVGALRVPFTQTCPLQAASAPQFFPGPADCGRPGGLPVQHMCYKAAVVGVAIIPAPLDDEHSLLAQADAGSHGGDGRVVMRFLTELLAGAAAEQFGYANLLAAGAAAARSGQQSGTGGCFLVVLQFCTPHPRTAVLSFRSENEPCKPFDLICSRSAAWVVSWLLPLDSQHPI